MKLSGRCRRSLLVGISVLCLGAGAGVLYGQRDPGGLAGLGTPTVGLLLGLILLPGATFAARRLERRLRRARWDRFAAE